VRTSHSTNTELLKISTVHFFAIVLLTFAWRNTADAQKMFGYSFSNYPVTRPYKGPRAPVLIKSNETAGRYKTQVKSQYSNAGIEFAGNYSMILWEAGTGGLTLGVMVDNSTGIVYDLPLTVENSNRGCWSSDHNFEKNIFYYKTSRLFITWTCKEDLNDATKTNLVTRNYSVFLWNEIKKKFIFLGNKIEKRVEMVAQR
jgi:hypothetical protein